MGSEKWLTNYPKSEVYHILSKFFDHRSIVMRVRGNNEIDKSKRLLKFEVAWILHDSFNDVVIEAWHENVGWEDATSKFSNSIRVWNHNLFGNILWRKKKITTRLDGIDKKKVLEKKPIFGEIIEEIVERI